MVLIIMMISVGKYWTPKVPRKPEEMKLKLSKVFQFGEKIPRHKMPKGTRTIGTPWADVNKQDEKDPLYRSRLVAQEVTKGSGLMSSSRLCQVYQL